MSYNLTQIVAKLQELCSPSRENMPSNINPKAISVWNYIISTYADSIYANDRDIGRQWGKASKFFEKCCGGKHLNPYINEPK